MLSLDISCDDANLIEFFFVQACQKKSGCLDLSMSEGSLSKVHAMYSNPRTTKQKSFHYKGITYTYDMGDDSQCAFSKVRKDYKQVCNNVHMYSFKHSKIPTHLFPCTNSIDHVSLCDVSEYKITNRISLLVRKDEHGSYLSLQYKHSDNVDIDKVRSCLESVITSVCKII